MSIKDIEKYYQQRPDRDKEELFRFLLVNNYVAEVIKNNLSSCREAISKVITDDKKIEDLKGEEVELVDIYFQGALIKIGKKLVLPRILHEFNNVVQTVESIPLIVDEPPSDDDIAFVEEIKLKISDLLSKLTDVEESGYHKYSVYNTGNMMVSLPDDSGKTTDVKLTNEELLREYKYIASNTVFTVDEQRSIENAMKEIKNQLEELESLLKQLYQRDVSGIKVLVFAIQEFLRIGNPLLKTVFEHYEDIIIWSKSVLDKYDEFVRLIRNIGEET